MAKRKAKKNPFQLELNFELQTGVIETKGTQLQFDFFNKRNNFFAQLYTNKGKLQIDILRLMLADKIQKTRKPVTRMLLFKNERTRKRITSANKSLFKRYNIKTTII